MRRLITWLIMVPAALAVVVFALNNKEPIQLNLWPFAMIIEMELYLVLTIVLGVGVVLGGVASWAGAGRLRSELRTKTYTGEVARRELKAEREKTAALESDLKHLKEQIAQAAAAPSAPGDDAREIVGEIAAQLPKPQARSSSAA